MSNMTSRFRLPRLHVAQAFKEITHNEALILIDSLLHPSVEETLSAPPILDAASAGKAYIVGAVATAAFAGHENHLAIWTGDQWRFVAPTDQMRVWHVADGSFVRFAESEWQSPSIVTIPAGGAVIDEEARASITTIVEELRKAGLITPE